MKRIRQNEAAANIDQWLTSPGIYLTRPERVGVPTSQAAMHVAYDIAKKSLLS